MNLSGPIRALIADNNAANAALQNRVYPGVFPEQYTLPAVAVNIIRVEPNSTKSGPSDIDAAMVQIDCYANTYGQAQDISDSIRLALDYYRGGVLIAGQIISIDYIDFEGQTDVWEEKPKEYRISCDYMVRVLRGNTILQVYGPYVDDAAAIADGRAVGDLYIVDVGNNAIPAGVIKKIGTSGNFGAGIPIPSGSNFLQVYGPYVDDAAAIADGRAVGNLYIVDAGNDAIPAGVIKKIGTP